MQPLLLLSKRQRGALEKREDIFYCSKKCYSTLTWPPGMYAAAASHKPLFVGLILLKLNLLQQHPAVVHQEELSS